jgi:hypothetical protein
MKSYFNRNKIKNGKNFIAFILFFFIIALFSLINFKNNIHGDAKFHSLYAKTSVEKSTLTKTQPNSIYTFDKNGAPIYTPIAYPLTSESLFSLFYLIGGDTALKLLAPIMAGIIFLLVYLCIIEIGSFWASIIALIGVLSMTERLVMTPLIEPFLVVVLLSGVFSLKEFFKKDNINYLILACIFLGTAAAIKQQGLAAAIFVFIYLLFYWIYKLFIKHYSFSRFFKFFLISTTLLITIPSIALLEQSNRNGTIAFAPGSTSIPSIVPFKNHIQPLFNSKFPSNPSSLKARDQGIGYNKRARTLHSKIDGFFLAPFLFYRAGDDYWQTIGYGWILFLVIILIGLETISKDEFIKRNRFFWGLLIFLLLEEILVSYIMKEEVHQYHSFGIIIATTLLFVSFRRLMRFSTKYLGLAFAVLILLFGIGYYNFAIPLWNDKGREDNYHLLGYEKIGKYVQSNTSESSIFLAAETNFRYYANRDIVWVNESRGKQVIDILNSSDPQFTLSNLKDLHVGYVMIDKSQTKFSGLYDYLPPQGLIDVVQNKAYFLKIYDPYNDGQMTVYKINYNKVAS